MPCRRRRGESAVARSGLQLISLIDSKARGLARVEQLGPVQELQRARKPIGPRILIMRRSRLFYHQQLLTHEAMPAKSGLKSMHIVHWFVD